MGLDPHNNKTCIFPKAPLVSGTGVNRSFPLRSLWIGIQFSYRSLVWEGEWLESSSSVEEVQWDALAVTVVTVGTLRRQT